MKSRLMHTRIGGDSFRATSATNPHSEALGLLRTLCRWREEGERSADLTEAIARRRTLVGDLELTLQQVCQVDGSMGGEEGVGASIRVLGMSLPRSIAINDQVHACMHRRGER